MTPTLTGRFETRVFLNLTVALPILTLTRFANIFFIMLALGLAFEVIYFAFQKKRWDGDWPLIFLFLTGALEGVILWSIVSVVTAVTLKPFMLIYSAIWLLTFAAQAGPLNIIFPYRRFRGGRILHKPN